MTQELNPEEEQKQAQEKEAKRLRLRDRSIKELVETERQYVHDLEVLNDVYIVPLTPSSKMQIVTTEQHRLLFNNIPSLYQLNSKFQSGLEQRHKNWDHATSKIADEFLQFAPYFHMYQGYCNSHEQAAGLVSKLEIRSSKFKKFVDAAQFDPKCNGLDLKSYLIKPLQRITKYTLILREIIKHTLEEHPDYADLQLAMQKINEVNITINEKMKTFDQRQKVRDIAARFTTNVDLVAPARYFIKEGKLTKICRKKDITYIFILFSDLLIYGEKASDHPTNYQVKIHQQIPINQSFRIRDIAQNAKYGAKCWEIHSPEKSFIVYAQHPGAKREWYQEMEKVVRLRQTIESRKQRPAALWVPDDFTEICMMPDCEHKFTVINRRHHCRYCGRLVCGPCSTSKLPHWTKSKKMVRVCTMCYAENKDLYKAIKRESKKTKSKESEKGVEKKEDLDLRGDDEDSLSAGSEIDFEYWDTPEEEDETEDELMELPAQYSINGLNSFTDRDPNASGSVLEVEKPKLSSEGSSKMKRSSTKRRGRDKKRQMKAIHQRSASVGHEADDVRAQASRGIFSNTAKVYRLKYEHAPKKSTHTLYELGPIFPKRTSVQPVSNGSLNLEKRNSESYSLTNEKPSLCNPPSKDGAAMASSNSKSAAQSGSSYDSDEEQKLAQQQLPDGTNQANGNTNSNAHASKQSNMSLSINMSHASQISMSMFAPSLGGTHTPRSTNKRLKLVGTGQLDIEAHAYDHELVSMRLRTFTEVIDWNLDPHSMKPKKKDEFSCYLKALNVLTSENEILLIRIKNKDIIDSLVTILVSLSYYYEAEHADRVDEDEDSEQESSQEQKQQTDDAGVTTVGLSKDNTLEEHKAEIERAVFLIENSKKHDNIKTIDVAKFLLAKSCPPSVIKHAFDTAGVEIPDEVYELAGIPQPSALAGTASLTLTSSSKKKKYKEKEKEMMQRSSLKKGKRAVKATKLLGTGFHRQSVANKRRSNSQDFGDQKKYKHKNGKVKHIGIPLQQSHSEEAKDPVDDWWIPPNTNLPDADSDKRYQEALCEHDKRFCLLNKVEEDAVSTLPSDKLDQQLRVVINSMSTFSVKGTGSPISPYDTGGNKTAVSFAAASATISNNKRTSKKHKKFSLFGSKKKEEVVD
eukprot:CAMPEP_0197034938 /NCGR_PEP_ID=MMETSP1384-20130603/12862_1 /TAXON_ID=29189 /ORGANISM="Ammonia sp." /LENGTH=1140 /DNA_ID=CAMNT_0042464913 /DNA_START=88 /DNA_END=3510 /DNA_ORIENTATION=-